MASNNQEVESQAGEVEEQVQEQVDEQMEEQYEEEQYEEGYEEEQVQEGEEQMEEHMEEQGEEHYEEQAEEHVEGEEQVDETMEEAEAGEEIKDEGIKEEDEEKVEEEKAEEKVAPMEEEKPKEPEKPKELEEDARADSRKKLSTPVSWNFSDCTLNVAPAFDGKLLMTLSDSGFQSLLGSVRANVGVKAGRHMFEVKIMEQNMFSSAGKLIKSTARIGLSLASASLLSDEEDNVYFDNDGMFTIGKRKINTKQRYVKGHTVALVVNLDDNSPNAHTVSVFINGNRCSEPQKLPEAWKGKVVYPMVAYRNVTLKANFGPATHNLPFTCTSIAEAAEADTEVVKPPTGQQEVLVAVGLPDQGVFDWADDFLAKNPSYTELSGRSILDWGVKSGLARTGAKMSLDRPAMNFGIMGIDDLSIVELVKAVAPMHKGNFLVLELRSNLVSADRAATIAKFPAEFKKRATVLMGEPNAEFKEAVHSMMLENKKIHVEAERKKKRESAEIRRKVAEAKKKARKDAGEAVEDEPEEKAEEEDIVDGPVALTEEEKKTVFRKRDAPDMAPAILSHCFNDFTMPSNEEGFTAIDFAWQNEATSRTHLADYITSKRLVSRVENIKPGEWFTNQLKEWGVLMNGWKKKQVDYKSPAAVKARIEKAAAEKKKTEEEKAKAEGEQAEGEEKAEEKAEGADGAEEKAEEPKEEAAAAEHIDLMEIDVFSVEDVNDIGSGEPLFSHFDWEDWALLSLRFELHLLIHSFKKDVDIPGVGVHKGHLGFYYGKYLNKPWTLRQWGCKTLEDLVELIEENVALEESGMLKALLVEDTPFSNFVQLTEEHRRSRLRRIEAGVESAALNFERPAPNTGGKGKDGKDGKKGYSKDGYSKDGYSKDGYSKDGKKGYSKDGKGKDSYGKGKWDNGYEKGKDKSAGKGKKAPQMVKPTIVRTGVIVPGAQAKVVQPADTTNSKNEQLLARLKAQQASGEKRPTPVGAAPAQPAWKQPRTVAPTGVRPPATVRPPFTIAPRVVTPNPRPTLTPRPRPPSATVPVRPQTVGAAPRYGTQPATTQTRPWAAEAKGAKAAGKAKDSGKGWTAKGDKGASSKDKSKGWKGKNSW